MIQLYTEQDFGTRGMNGIMVDNQNGLISPIILKSAYSWTCRNLYNIRDLEQNYINFDIDQLNQLPSFQIFFDTSYSLKEVERHARLLNEYAHYKCVIPVREPLSRYASAMAEVIYREFLKAGNAKDTDMETNCRYLEYYIEYRDIWDNPTEFKYDVHLRSQTAIMASMPKKQDNVAWFKVDTYTEDLKKWLKENNISKKLDNQPYNSSTSNPFKSFVQGYISSMLNYDRQFKQKVMEYYKEDIELYDSLCV